MKYDVLLFPLDFLLFWFIQAPKSLLFYFYSLNISFFRFCSIGLFLKTFFRPIKNEYRKGLVGFSIGMGMFVKLLLIVFSLFLFLFLLGLEILVFVSFLLLPFSIFFIAFH